MYSPSSVSVGTLVTPASCSPVPRTQPPEREHGRVLAERERERVRRHPSSPRPAAASVEQRRRGDAARVALRERRVREAEDPVVARAREEVVPRRDARHRHVRASPTLGPRRDAHRNRDARPLARAVRHRDRLAAHLGAVERGRAPRRTSTSMPRARGDEPRVDDERVPSAPPPNSSVTTCAPPTTRSRPARRRRPRYALLLLPFDDGAADAPGAERDAGSIAAARGAPREAWRASPRSRSPWCRAACARRARAGWGPPRRPRSTPRRGWRRASCRLRIVVSRHVRRQARRAIARTLLQQSKLCRTSRAVPHTMRRLALFAAVAAARATDDAAARRRLCATDPEGGFGSGRWSRAPTTRRARSRRSTGLRPTRRSCGGTGRPTAPSARCARRARARARGRRRARRARRARRTRCATCSSARRRASCSRSATRSSRRSSSSLVLDAAAPPARPRALLVEVGAASATSELACRGGWNVSFVHLSTHMARARRAAASARGARTKRAFSRAPRFRESMRALPREEGLCSRPSCSLCVARTRSVAHSCRRTRTPRTGPRTTSSGRRTASISSAPPPPPAAASAPARPPLGAGFASAGGSRLARPRPARARARARARCARRRRAPPRPAARARSWRRARALGGAGDARPVAARSVAEVLGAADEAVDAQTSAGALCHEACRRWRWSRAPPCSRLARPVLPVGARERHALRAARGRGRERRARPSRRGGSRSCSRPRRTARRRERRRVADDAEARALSLFRCTSSSRTRSASCS